MKNQIAIIDVFNGEGYSQPTIKICPDEASARISFAKLRNDYVRSGWESDGVAEFSKNSTYFKNGNDNGALHKIELVEKYMLLKICPDECEVTPYLHSNDKSVVLEYLGVMVKGVGIVDYDTNTEMVVSGHTNDGFIHFEVIETISN